MASVSWSTGWSTASVNMNLIDTSPSEAISMIDDGGTRPRKFESTAGAGSSMTLPVRLFDQAGQSSLGQRSRARTAGPVTAIGVPRRWSATSRVQTAPPKQRLADLPRHPVGRAELLARAGADVPILTSQESTRQTPATYPIATDDNGLVATDTARASKRIPPLQALVDHVVRGQWGR
jgi:hypothetical protein